MRIVFLCHYFPPEGNAPAARTFEHAKRWVAEGIDVTVITSTPNVPHGRVYPGYRNRLWQLEYLDGVQVIRVWTYVAANSGTLRRTLNYLSFMISASIAGIFCKRPRAVLATSPQFFCGWAGVILSRLKQVPLILEIRDIWPDSIAAVGAISQPTTLRFLSYLEQLMYRAADSIVTVGDGYQQALIERKVPRKKISIVPNGADLDRFSPQTPGQGVTLTPNHRETSDVFRCVYIGTVGMASRLDLLIAAAETLENRGDKSIELLIVGDGADRNRLEKKVADKGIQNLEFTGLVSKSEIPTIMENSDACLVHLREDPLFRTVLPSKMFEAMAMKKPVILAVPGAAAKILEQAEAGLTIRPENHLDLLNAIERLKTNPELSSKLGRNGRAFTESKYNRDYFAKDYLARTIRKYQ